MNLKPWQQWAIRQALGTKRGERVIALLSGPIGAMIDMVLEGRPTEALARLDQTVEAVRKVLS